MTKPLNAGNNIQGVIYSSDMSLSSCFSMYS